MRVIFHPEFPKDIRRFEAAASLFPTVLRHGFAKKSMRRWTRSRQPPAAPDRKAPNPKLQPPEKFQGPNFNAPPWVATTSLGLGLELEIWSFFGAWCLGLCASLRAVFHRKQRRTQTFHRSLCTR